MWLCFPCMHYYSWKRPCRDYAGGVLSVPFNSRSADFIIYGVYKPKVQTSTPNGCDGTSTSTNIEDASMGLSLELLNKIFQKQITTTSSIPPQCRLNFSRTLKTSLDKVLLRPNELSSWLHLILLPICTLNLFVPKSSREERSGNRKRIQTESINQALA